MQYSTVTQKGQITIPIDIRKALDIKEGDKIAFTKVDDNITLTISHKIPLSALYGYLPKPDHTLSIEEMNSIIENKQENKS